MKVIYNKFIPFQGFFAMNFFGVLFVRAQKGTAISEQTYNHEAIHTAQMKDFCKWLPLGGLLFYIVYVGEWLIRLLQYGSQAYHNISFEREAYKNASNMNYLENRKRWNWFKYLKNN